MRFKEIKSKNGSIYFPINCPWPSEESEEISKAAHDRYNELIKSRKPVFLIMSNHFATQGYWIEFKKENLSGIDILIKSHE